MNPAPSVTGSASSLGGELVDITYRNGAKSPVLVRELEVDPSLLKFIDLQMNEPALAEFVCGKEPGWAKTLKPGSLLDIVEKAKDINFTTALRWAKHRAAIIGDLKPMGLLTNEKPSTSASPVPA